MPRNYKTGEVTCDKCGVYIGNYLTDDYYRLIKVKYCPKCKTEVRKENQRIYKHDRRFYQKQAHKELKKQIKLLTEQNSLLVKQIIDLKNEK